MFSLVLTLLLIQESTFSQAETIADSVRIDLVEISSIRYELLRNDNLVQEFDSKQIQRFAHFSLAESLDHFSLANVNSYGGNGAAANLSIRGASPDHSQVLWNGFEINAISLGQMDLSLVGTNAFEHVKILYGASAGQFGSGSLGGAVLLQDNKKWYRNLNLDHTFQFGSFGDIKNALRISNGNRRYSYKVDLSYHTAENNFKFSDDRLGGNIVKLQTHNALSNLQFNQALKITFHDNHIVTLGSWFLDKEKEIPLLRSQNGESNQMQYDRALRNYVKWNYQTNRIQLEYGLAQMDEQFRYTDKVTKTDPDFIIDSNIEMSKWMHSFNLEHRTRHDLSLSLGADLKDYTVATNNYVQSSREVFGSVYSDLKYTKARYELLASLRKEWDVLSSIRPLASVSAKINLVDQVDLVFGYSDKFRRADFNQRYWSAEGAQGNKDLKNEYGKSFELGLQGTMAFAKSQWTLNAYSNTLKDGIVWRPANNIWTPINLNSLIMRGMELQWDGRIALNKTLELPFALAYHYNVSKDGATNALLAYKPKQNLKMNIGLERKEFAFYLHYKYISGQFSDDSENALFALPAYQLLHVSVSKQLVGRLRHFNLSFRVNNFFDKDYEIRRAYIQAGRSYNLIIRYSLN